MKFVKILILALAWVACSLVAGQQAHAQTFVVDDDAQCSGANYTRIQDAVNDAPAGATIAVCPGIYAEQLRLDKALTLRGFETNAQNQAVIRPSQLAESVNIGGTPVAAIVYVTNAVDVNLEGITIDGAANDVSGCSPFLMGVLYFKASGVIRGSTIKNIRLSDPQQAGCQSGVGIFVLSGSDAGDGFSNVQIVDNRLFDYQKAGIAANDAHTQVLINNNTLTGDGAIATNAQDGIQVAFGARGSVSNNTVSDHIYTPCDTYENCTFAGKNIIVFESDDVNVTGNTVRRSQLNIRVTGDRTSIRDNIIADAITRDAIFVVGDFNDIISNSITNASAAAIFVRGSYNTVAYNSINEARTGIEESAPSNNNVFLGNTFTNTERPMLLLSPTAMISGQAYTLASGNTRQPLSGVHITLASGGASLVAQTDADGRYAFTNLAAATYTVTPTPNADYAFTPASRYVALAGANISDADFNGTPPATTPPNVTINQATRQADPTSESPVNFTVTFSEPVTGFDSSDVTLGGSAGATTITITNGGDNLTSNVAVGGFMTSGTVTASVRANAGVDAAGNANTASTSTDTSVTYNAPDQITSPIVVTSAADSGAGSLREAIMLANRDGGADTINFQIGNGEAQINLTSALPPILESLTLDGTTQPSFNGSPLITLDGAAAGSGANGLRLEAGNSAVRGLVITGFGGNGIFISGAGNNVVEGNRITNNGGNGIGVESTGNRITTNSIFANGGLGIDLGANGVTTNDAQDTDAGANNLQNYPVISSASAGSTRLAGRLNSTPDSTFRLEFFNSPSADGSGFGEGQTFIGSIDVTTDGSGNAVSSTTPGVFYTGRNFNVTFPFNSQVGQVITATATNTATGDTSEFSQAKAVTPQPTAAEVTISGRVTNSRSAPLAGATVRLGGARQATTVTDAQGNYSFTVPVGELYTVMVMRAGYTFTPPMRDFGGSITANQTADFTATALKGRTFRTPRLR